MDRNLIFPSLFHIMIIGYMYIRDTYKLLFQLLYIIEVISSPQVCMYILILDFFL